MAAVARYDGRSAMGLSETVKAQHRLPFFANFVHLAARIEELLGGLEPARAGAGPARVAGVLRHAERACVHGAIQPACRANVLLLQPEAWPCRAILLRGARRRAPAACQLSADRTRGRAGPAPATASADAEDASAPASRASSADSIGRGAPLRFGGSTAGAGGGLEYELTDDEDADAPSSRSSADGGCAASELRFRV